MAHGAFPHRIDYCCIHSKIVCCCSMLFEHHPYYARANLAHQDIPTLLQRLLVAVWEHSPLLSGLGAASTTAARCISAGAPPRPFTCFRHRFFSFRSSRVSCFCTPTPSSFPLKTPKAVLCFFCFVILFLGFVFLRSYEPLIYNHCCRTRYVLSYYHTPYEYVYVLL